MNGPAGFEQDKQNRWWHTSNDPFESNSDALTPNHLTSSSFTAPFRPGAFFSPSFPNHADSDSGGHLLSGGGPFSAGPDSAPAASHRRGRVYAFSTGALVLDQAAVLCCFWDLESTGLSVQTDHIIQIGCTVRLFHIPAAPGCLGYFSRIRGIPDNEHDFSVYVKTDKPIPPEVSELTGIDASVLEEHGVDLSDALAQWESWLSDLKQGARDEIQDECELWLVAHNGNQFDLPLLFHQELDRLRWSPGTFLKQIGVQAIVDSVVLSRAIHCAEMTAHGRSHRLNDLYWEAFAMTIENEHDALSDAKAVSLVMAQEPFLTAWSRDFVAWRLADYIQAFHRAFDRRGDPLGRRMAELQINRWLSDSVHQGVNRSFLHPEIRKTASTGFHRLSSSTGGVAPLPAAPPRNISEFSTSSPACRLWRSFRSKDPSSTHPERKQTDHRLNTT